MMFEKNEKRELPLACVILAAGLGTRMKSVLPKVLHPVAGVPMVRHVVAACEALEPEKIIIVVSPNSDAVCDVVRPHACVAQDPPLGTGDAAKAARKALKDFTGDILILFGDAALMTPEALRSLREKKAETGAALVIGGFLPDDPGGYGRLIVNEKGWLEAIVEVKDATPEQAAIKLCNGGSLLCEADKLWRLLEKIENKNAKGEYYLTDCVHLARAEGLVCALALCENDDVRGVNTRVELAEVEAVMQRRLREKAMLAGVSMQHPDSVFLCADTQFGQDVVIGPHVVFGPGVRVGANVEIRSFSHLEKAEIAAGAIIGPFARLRPGANIGADAHIGNFVEIKNATIEAGAKVNHLSYIGDARVGEKTNIGAGTITCNYDGFTKSRTDIGAGAFIGSNTALVAPVNIGDGASIGAGSTITKDVPSQALGVARAKQSNLEGWAARFRSQKEKS